MEEKTERIEMRLNTSFLKTVDNWRRKQRDLPSRAEAIRRLAECGLASSTATPPQLRKGSRRKAAEMADREIDRLGDQAVTNEERARRKRRLIKGPREFRGLRTDLPKNKN
jgi:metal-responsive CopG/Arc/MetJ family transcriptional regulator